MKKLNKEYFFYDPVEKSNVRDIYGFCYNYCESSSDYMWRRQNTVRIINTVVDTEKPYFKSKYYDNFEKCIPRFKIFDEDNNLIDDPQKRKKILLRSSFDAIFIKSVYDLSIHDGFHRVLKEDNLKYSHAAYMVIDYPVADKRVYKIRINKFLKNSGISAHVELSSINDSVYHARVFFNSNTDYNLFHLLVGNEMDLGSDDCGFGVHYFDLAEEKRKILSHMRGVYRKNRKRIFG